jgi:hypothetical protein
MTYAFILTLIVGKIRQHLIFNLSTEKNSLKLSKNIYFPNQNLKI